MKRSMLNLLVIVAVLLASALAVDAEEKSAKFYFDRGVEEGDKGRYDRGIADLTKALELTPKLAEAYNNRAVAYYSKKDYDKAWEDVHKAESLVYKVHPGFLQELRHTAFRIYRLNKLNLAPISNREKSRPHPLVLHCLNTLWFQTKHLLIYLYRRLKILYNYRYVINLLNHVFPPFPNPGFI